MTTTNHVEPETIAMLQDVMEDGFESLIESYISDSRNRMGDLQAAFEARDSEQIRRVAHSLKGSSGNVGALGMAELCLKVEQQGKDGELDGVAELLGEIEQEFQRVFEIMQGYIH